jgi:hypothetical protein
MYKFISSVFLLFLLNAHSYAQKWMSMMEDPDINFYEVQKEFYDFYKSKLENSSDEPRKDGPYSRFKKWNWK